MIVMTISRVTDGATLPGPASSSGQTLTQPQGQSAPPQYVFSFGGDIIEQQPPQIKQRFGSEGAFSMGSSNAATHKRKKASNDTVAKANKKGFDTGAKPIMTDQFGPPPEPPTLSLLSAAKITALTQLPVNLLKAFNGGDIQKVREIIRENTSKTCALRTPALDAELYGQNYICDFFESVYDSHPDAVWVAKKSKYVPERCEVSCRIYFAGTRVAQGSKGTDLAGVYSEHLFKKKGSSLLDEMDVSALTEAEICAMRELENLGCNLSVFGKGTMTLLVDEEAGGKITKFSVMWVITSFRQATV
jgi:hypothetical protein